MRLSTNLPRTTIRKNRRSVLCLRDKTVRRGVRFSGEKKDPTMVGASTTSVPCHPDDGSDLCFDSLVN
jgi:hypothetical protein